MNKCAWCNERGENLKNEDLPAIDRLGFQAGQKKFYVHSECESDLRKFVEFINRYTRFFIIFMASSILAMLVFLIFAISISQLIGLVLIGTDVILIGVVIFLFPFATPETIKMMGFKKARNLVRILAPMVMALGAWVIMLTL